MYPDRIIRILDVCPDAKVTAYDFNGLYSEGWRRHFSISWSNTGKNPIVAIQLRALNFDAFDDALESYVLDQPGKPDYNPLAPGEEAKNGATQDAGGDVFSSFAYVAKIRFKDGTIWKADAAQITATKAKASAQK